MESLPYYCKSSKLCKQINPSNPERPKPLRFLHHLWGHQSVAITLMHEGIFRSMCVLIWRVSLNQNLDQPSLVLLQQLFQQEWSLLSPAKGEKEKKRKNEQKRKRKKSTIIFRFLVGELSSMTRITMARKYLNRIESKPPWFQSLKFNFPVIRRNSLLSVQRCWLAWLKTGLFNSHISLMTAHFKI